MTPNYYGYFLDVNFASIGFKKPFSNSIVEVFNFDGDVFPNWVPVECIEFGEDEEGNGVPRGDFACLESYVDFPVMNQYAWESLASIIGQQCEPLPIIHPSGESYFLVRVKFATDALNREASKFSAASDGRISNIYDYSFFDSKVADVPIFRLSHRDGGDTVVTDKFREAVEASQLKGFYFEKLKVVH